MRRFPALAAAAFGFLCLAAQPGCRSLGEILAAEGSIRETGLASFYAGRFVGRKTANGEIYNPATLTAAHRELPFDTRVRVTNLENDRSVVVRINNRGPFIEGRIIDLSVRAARKLRMIDAGVVRVRVEVLGS